MCLFVKPPREFTTNFAGNLNDRPQSNLGEESAPVIGLSHRAASVIMIFRHYNSRVGAEM